MGFLGYGCKGLKVSGQGVVTVPQVEVVKCYGFDFMGQVTAPLAGVYTDCLWVRGERLWVGM